jgi:hypothetical protein
MAHLTEEDQEKALIDVLLNEYQACHRNINHFDGVRWTIGSIFIGASLTLFGISFDKRLIEVGLAFFFSLFLMLAWYLYFQHVNPYVLVSILRIHQIEKTLRDMELKNMKLDIGLHRLIFMEEEKIFHIKGIWITFILIISIVGMWLLRIAVLINRSSYYLIAIGMIYAGFVLCFWWAHFTKFNTLKLGKRIRETSNVSEEKKEGIKQTLSS